MTSWLTGSFPHETRIPMNSIHDDSMVLAGDIGGTKTDLGLFVRGKTRPRLKIAETYSSLDADRPEDIIEKFLRKHEVPVGGACLGIAGPVINGRCRTTNLPWEVSETGIMDRFKWKKVRLINDLKAAALSIPLLNSRELLRLNRARAPRGRNLGLIAPGTGLGTALLIHREGGYHAVPSEGGHVDFSPNNQDQVELWRFLHKRLGHVSVERVLSGPGLLNIYAWMRSTGRYREPEWLPKEMEELDPAVITHGALGRKDPLCISVVKMFVSVLGAVSGNLALTAMTTGGIYLGGGIPPRIVSLLEQGYFMEAFTDKGRFRNLLEKIPVKVIMNQKAALMGAARCALEL